MVFDGRSSSTTGCEYCDVVYGVSPAVVVYEDDDVIALVAPEPLHPGHCVLVTKAHLKALHELDARLATHLWLVALTIERAIAKAGLRDEGLSFVVSEGLATQGLEHLQLHLVPRVARDAWSVLERHGATHADPRLSERVARRLREHLS